jgi:exosortase A-associated hydrolase 2
MNRTRRTVRCLADRAMDAGMAVIEVDLHGTGDSEGDFADGRWETWLEDLDHAAARLAALGCPGIVLLGIRGGSLLAWDLLALDPGRYVAAILWQPVTTGERVMTELLRLRVAAGAQSGGRQTLAELRQCLRSGQPVETAGYSITPELFGALETRALAPLGQTQLPVLWLEIGGDAPRTGSAAVVNRLAASGMAVTLRHLEDPPFWSTTEVTIGEATITTTLDILRRLPV